MVGARSVLWPGSYLGEGSQLGEDCVLQPGAIVRERCVLGRRVMLQPGVVVGSDGFGFAFDPVRARRTSRCRRSGTCGSRTTSRWAPCSCIDRGDARRDGHRPGHEDRQPGADRPQRPGGAALHRLRAGGHLRLHRDRRRGGARRPGGHRRARAIGDGAKVAAQSGVPHDVPPGATFSGSPAVDTGAVAARSPRR